MSMKHAGGGNEAATIFRLAYRAMGPMMRDKAGVTAIEYGLIAALIAIVILGSVTTLGGVLQAMWELIATKLMASL